MGHKHWLFPDVKEEVKLSRYFFRGFNDEQEEVVKQALRYLPEPKIPEILIVNTPSLYKTRYAFAYYHAMPPRRIDIDEGFLNYHVRRIKNAKQLDILTPQEKKKILAKGKYSLVGALAHEYAHAHGKGEGGASQFAADIMEKLWGPE